MNGKPYNMKLALMIVTYFAFVAVFAFTIYFWCLVRTLFLAIGNDDQITREQKDDDDVHSFSSEDSEKQAFLQSFPLSPNANENKSSGVNFTNI